jgi:hypothetical protein
MYLFILQACVVEFTEVRVWCDSTVL